MSMNQHQHINRSAVFIGGRLNGAAAIFLTWLAATAPAWAASPGAWVTDPFRACRVWNPHPMANETVAWSGACENGLAQGRGATRWLRNGVVFETDEGEWRDGRQVGLGKQDWPGGRYEGELTDSEPHGYGILTLRSLRYEGEFRNGKPNGPGTMTTATEVFQGQWKDGCFKNGKRRAAVVVALSSCP